jgi:hypothetical protein
MGEQRPRAALEIKTVRALSLFVLMRLANRAATLISVGLPESTFGKLF